MDGVVVNKKLHSLRFRVTYVFVLAISVDAYAEHCNNKHHVCVETVLDV